MPAMSPGSSWPRRVRSAVLAKLVWFFVLAALFSASRSLAAATTQDWSLAGAPIDTGSIPPDAGDNPFGAPAGSAPGSTWEATHNGRSGVLLLAAAGGATFGIPNLPLPGKKVREVVMIYRLSDASQLNPMDRPVVGSPNGPMAITGARDAVLDQRWRQLDLSFQSGGCPASGLVAVRAPAGLTMRLDDFLVLLAGRIPRRSRARFSG